MALIFFHLSLEDPGTYRTLVDLVTALEALVSDGQGEIKYKFAMRVSVLIETNLDKRKELCSKLKNIYNVRSSITHGSEISLNPVAEYQENIEFLKPVVKQAILKYIELGEGKTKTQTLEAIDELLLK